MTPPIPVHLAVEDEVSEMLLRVMLEQSRRPFAIGRCYSRGGFGYLRKSIAGFNSAAKGCPFIVLTDLDTASCAPELCSSWLSQPKHHNLVFRVAVREAESWVLADRPACSAFLGVAQRTIPTAIDDIADPKKLLTSLARRSRFGTIKREVAPPPGSLRSVGPLYNSHVVRFVREKWDAQRARAMSDSCDRAMRCLERFQPQWSS